MSLALATIIPAALLLVLGLALLSGRAMVAAIAKQFPRSSTAAIVFFGGAALWFLYKVWHLPEADFGNHRTLLAIGFGAIAALSFKYVPDFLAVRGLAILVLLSASPLLGAAYMKYELPQRRCIWARCLTGCAILSSGSLADRLAAASLARCSRATVRCSPSSRRLTERS